MRIKERPHRLPPETYRGPIGVAFTCCIADHQSPFVEPVIVETFVSILSEQAARFDCIVAAYCFMPDHLHVSLRGRSEDADALKVMKAFKYKTGLWFGKHRPDLGWQKGFYDHVYRNKQDGLEQVRYILKNPVRAGLVDDFRDYPFLGSIGVDLDEVLSDL